MPWVADYRDCWSTTRLHAQGPLVPSLRAWDTALERRWVGTAAFFTAASPDFVGGIERVVRRPGHALLTGFSEEEFAREEEAPFPEFTLCYLGTLHPAQRVESLLRAVTRLLAGVGPEAKFRMRMLGVRYYPSEADRVQRAVTGFERHFEFTARLPRAEALRFLVSLAPAGPDGIRGLRRGDGRQDHEYMAARRPILLFPSDSGILADMVGGTGSGFVAESEDAAGAPAGTLPRVGEHGSSGFPAGPRSPGPLLAKSTGAETGRVPRRASGPPMTTEPPAGGTGKDHRR